METLGHFVIIDNVFLFYKMIKLSGIIIIIMIVTLFPQAFKETRGMAIGCEQVRIQSCLIRVKTLPF
jgi:hypothetical protein